MEKPQAEKACFSLENETEAVKKLWSNSETNQIHEEAHQVHRRKTRRAGTKNADELREKDMD